MLHTKIYYKNDVMAMKEVLKERLDNSVDGEELTEALVLLRTRAPDLESVRKLNCWACNIGDVNIVRRMPNLEVCSLTINKLTSLRDFSHCNNLQELYVRTNNIQHLSDIHYLKNLKKLRSLWLSENPCASGDNYRPTVLKVLPNLHKLDNVAVTGEEVARAQIEGDDLPIPDDFSFSAVLRETTLSSEYSTDAKKEETVSVSSDKWARPRQKRQQKKREEYWREKRGAGDDSGSVKSTEDGGVCSIRSSSDSADGEEVYSPTSSSRHEAVEQEHEEEEDANCEMINDVNFDDDEAKKDTPSTKAKWALNIEILNSKTLDTQDNLELKVENLDNLMDSDKNNVDKMYTGGTVEETNLEEEKTCNNSTDQNNKNEDNQAQDVFVKSSNVETEFSKVSKLLNSSIFLEENPEMSNSTDSSKHLLASDKDPVVKLTTSVFSIDVAKMVSADFNTNANTDGAAQIEETKADQLILEDPNYTSTHSFKVSEQTDTPLLDNIKLEESLEAVDLVDDQTIESKHIGSMEEELKIELPDLATQTAGSETISWHPFVQSVSDVREPVNWEEYNRMRVQLGVEPVNRISITTRSFNSDMMRARNSNVLQAVLCLVKELDRDSLDIVATVVKARLDST